MMNKTPSRRRRREREREKCVCMCVCVRFFVFGKILSVQLLRFESVTVGGREGGRERFSFIVLGKIIQELVGEEISSSSSD